MDRVRRNLREAIARRDTNMATVSRHAGKNHAYIQQFMEGTPRKLPEDVRKSIADFLGISENVLKDLPHAQNGVDSSDIPASEYDAATNDKGEAVMTIVSVIRALVEEHGADAVARAVAKAVKPEKAVSSPQDRQRTS